MCGINMDNIQRRLLSETELTLKKTLKLALSLEEAAKHAQELYAPRPAEAVIRMTSGPSNGRGSTSRNCCFRCRKEDHTPAQCPFKAARCHNCGKVGHIRKTCRSKPKKQNSPRKPVKVVQEGADLDSSEYKLHRVTSKSQSQPLEVNLEIEGQKVIMESDTGAAVSLVSEATYQHLWSNQPLKESDARLCTYSGEPLAELREMEVEVCYSDQQEKLPLLVLKGKGPCLFS